MSPGAHIEIVDPTSSGDFLTPSRVLINGMDVGAIAIDGVSIVTGDHHNLTQVTITLMPGRVTIRGADSEAS